MKFPFLTKKSEEINDVYNPAEESNEPFESKLDQTRITKMADKFKKYSEKKADLDGRILENDRWYKSQHWDIIRQKTQKQKAENDQDPEPITAYLFNMIHSKHADAIDNYPEPNLLPRVQDDEKEADSLTNIIPLVIEKNQFKKTYSRGWWYKLKQGAVAYGVFYNYELENGLGDIDIQKLDLLNVFWEPGIEDIQKSPYLFIRSWVDDDILLAQYQDIITKENIQAARSGASTQQYAHTNIDIEDKSEVIDCYYKTYNKDGRQIVHMTKLVGETKLESTEDDPDFVERGIYDHGLYPVVIDVLFPDEGSPVGFGLVDIFKNQQMYIDKLDQIILKNAAVSGKQRFILKENGPIEGKDLLDMSKDIIYFRGTGPISDAYGVFQANPLNPFIVQHRQAKIEEGKEITGNRDFSQGGTSGGVTAYGAIVALQEAGNKLSRDMISESYDAYTQIIYMCIELIRQFYDQDRKFRIEGSDGTAQYVEYNNSGLQPQQLPPAIPGDDYLRDETGNVVIDQNGNPVQDPNYDYDFRKPVFDIKVKPEKANPFSKAAMNQLAIDMFGGGMFNPEQAPATLIALEMMSFEGKEKIIKMVKENGTMYQQMQMMAQQMQQYQQLINNMGIVIEKATGKNPLQDPNVLQIPQDKGGASK